MRILYIFPHPDDESFGPAPAMSAQLGEGHEVFLLTLTRGEATKQRHKLGITKDEMGEIRYKEMLCVEKTLGLSGMEVLDLPDNKLKWMDPIDIENVVEEHIHTLKPEILVTYAVHGISGFHDHLVTHAVVKRVFCKLRKTEQGYAKRLALFTRMGEVETKGKFRLEASADEEISFIQKCDKEDMKRFEAALDCYKTYKEVIEASNVKELTTSEVPFEIFGEEVKGRLKHISEGL